MIDTWSTVNICFESSWQKQSQELTSVKPDLNIFSKNVELTPTFSMSFRSSLKPETTFKPFKTDPGERYGWDY